MRIAHSVEQVPETEWQGLVAGHPAPRVEALKAITNTATRSLPFLRIHQARMRRKYQ